MNWLKKMKGTRRQSDDRTDDSISEHIANVGRAAGTRPVGSASRRKKASSSLTESDIARLQKDAKSRYNMGLVYLKTGDHDKAQYNLELSLHCHMQLYGRDTKSYTNEILLAIAELREKLGDCYLANPAIVDKCLASDHYEESKRLLMDNYSPEDRPCIVIEMMARVEKQLRFPELSSREARNRVQPAAGAVSNGRKMEGNDKAKAKKTNAQLMLSKQIAFL